MVCPDSAPPLRSSLRPSALLGSRCCAAGFSLPVACPVSSCSFPLSQVPPALADVPWLPHGSVCSAPPVRSVWCSLFAPGLLLPWLLRLALRPVACVLRLWCPVTSSRLCLPMFSLRLFCSRCLLSCTSAAVSCRSLSSGCAVVGCVVFPSRLLPRRSSLLLARVFFFACVSRFVASAPHISLRWLRFCSGACSWLSGLSLAPFPPVWPGLRFALFVLFVALPCCRSAPFCFALLVPASVLLSPRQLRSLCAPLCPPFGCVAGWRLLVGSFPCNFGPTLLCASFPAPVSRPFLFVFLTIPVCGRLPCLCAWLSVSVSVRSLRFFLPGSPLS